MAKKLSARHTPQSFSDQETISSLSAWIARTRRAMPDLKANDKWPNIDGYVELTDKNGHYLGTVKIQVKKLSQSDSSHRRFTFSKKESREKFIGYCEESKDLPIILVGVDLKNQIAYWVCIDAEFLNGLEEQPIVFQDGNNISLEDASFVEGWQKIVKDEAELKSIAQGFSPSDLRLITETATPILGKEDDNFRSIHVFLDSLNALLDTDFQVVKKVMYLNCWKVGFAYLEYSQATVSYIIYPVPLSKNDTLIKVVDNDLFLKFQRQGLGYAMHSGTNPILENPQAEAARIVQQRLKQVVDKQLFSHAGSEPLAIEYIFAFINRYSEQLNMTPNLDSYKIDEILISFGQYLPFWLDEAFEMMRSTNQNGFNQRLNDGRINYYSLNLWNELPANKREIVKSNALERFSKKEEVPYLPISAEILSPRIFSELLNYLKRSGVHMITRPYKQRNYGSGSGALSQTLTPDEVAHNLKVFFQNFPDAYKAFLDNNFPSLPEKFSYLDGANKIIFVYDLQSPIHPTITTYFLHAPEVLGATIEIYEKSEFGIDVGLFDQELTFKGTKYKIIGSPSGSLDFIFHDTPLLEMIYKTIKDKLNQNGY